MGVGRKGRPRLRGTYCGTVLAWSWGRGGDTLRPLACFVSRLQEKEAPTEGASAEAQRQGPDVTNQAERGRRKKWAGDIVKNQSRVHGEPITDQLRQRQQATGA